MSTTREEGQTMTEYAVILAVITPAIILAFSLLSGTTQGMINSIVGAL